MQLFMPFYFWTLHLIQWFIYSKQRHNLQDCNKPGAQSRYERSQWHTIRSPLVRRAMAACWVTPGQCHQQQPWVLTGVGPAQVPTTPFSLGEDQKRVLFHPATPKSPQCPPSAKSHHPSAMLGNFGTIRPVAAAPVHHLVMWEVAEKGTFHSLFNVFW